jgi:hypothetical protein
MKYFSNFVPLFSGLPLAAILRNGEKSWQTDW